MRKYFAILTALAALGMGSAAAQQQERAWTWYSTPNMEAGLAKAQQREAILYTVELPKAAFNIVIATAKPGGWSGYIQNLGYPEAHVAYLMGAELWHPLNDELVNVLKNARAWSTPTCSFHAEGKEPWQQSPVAVYVVPKEKPYPILTR